MGYATRFLLTIALFLCSVVAASAQRIDYSDAWMVIAETSGSLAGCAITDESYNNYGHEYLVSATLTSDDNRTSTASGGNGSCGTGNIQCARADVSLPYLTEEGFLNGLYTLHSVHQGVCPYYNMELDEVQKDIPLYAGMSISVLTKAALSNHYTIIANCNVHCPTETFESAFNRGQYIRSVVTWVYTYGYRCSSVNLPYPGSFSSQCEDLMGVIYLPFP